MNESTQGYNFPIQERNQPYTVKQLLEMVEDCNKMEELPPQELPPTLWGPQ